MLVQCPFCHKRVLKWWYDAHERKHTKLRSDGQMRDHITKPVAERHSGSLDGAPRVYQHSVCGALTQMPEEIIRSYLVFPLLYTDATFCCGCCKYVSTETVKWVETGEVVLSYIARLRLEYLRTVRGIAVQDADNDILVTPEAAAAIRAAFPDVPPSQLHLRLELIEDPSFEEPLFQANASIEADPEREIVIACAGLPVVVRKDQANRIRGVAVDVGNEGARTGLNVCRLSLPRASQM